MPPPALPPRPPLRAPSPRLLLSLLSLLAPLLSLLSLLPHPTAPQFRAEKKVLYEDFPEIDYVFAVPKPVDTGGKSDGGDAAAGGMDGTGTAAGDEPVDPVTGLTEAEMIFLGLKVEAKAKSLEAQLQIVKDLSTIKPSQSRYISVLRDLQKKTSVADLDQLLKMHPDILAVKVNDYVYQDYPIWTTQWNRGVDYRVEVIFDPCYKRPFDCCIGIFGTPEYVDFKSKRVYYRDMGLIREDNRRYPAFYKDFTDPSDKIKGVCKTNARTGQLDRHYETMLPTGNNTKSVIVNDLTCEADYLERRESPTMPRCWDYNQTVRSSGIVTDTYAVKATCIDGKGVTRTNCVTVGYSINTYLFQCHSKYDPAKCGTWLEIHIPGDERVISERHLPGG
jgi:hypothetical protein